MNKEAKKTFGISIILSLLVFSVYYSSGYFGENTPKDKGKLVKIEEVKDLEEVFVQEVQDRGGIFAKFTARAKEIVSKMTLNDKVGQMFLVRCPEENQLSLIKDCLPGGFLLSEKDFEGKSWQRVVGDVKSYQYTTKVPMFIAVDEEGGDVVRVSAFKEFRGFPFLSPQEIFLSDGFKGIELDTAEKSQLLKRLGINLNFAPVCDVTTDEYAYMYDRSFGMDAASTATYVKTVVSSMTNNGMGSVLKYFPGYGNNRELDTLVFRDKRDLATIDKNDLVPFRAGISEGAAGILVSNLIVEGIDKENPASLSVDVHKLLRNNLEYQGVIIADAMDASDIAMFRNKKDFAVRAVKAGNDMIIVSNATDQIRSVIDAVKDGEIPVSAIDAAATRILSWKIMQGMVN